MGSSAVTVLRHVVSREYDWCMYYILYVLLVLLRTDWGDKDIATYFKTQICGDTCRALGLLDKEAQTIEALSSFFFFFP